MLSAALLLLSNSLFLTLHLSGNPRVVSPSFVPTGGAGVPGAVGQGRPVCPQPPGGAQSPPGAHIIKKYYTQAANQEDLISIGTIGLIKAVNTFPAGQKNPPGNLCVQVH